MIFRSGKALAYVGVVVCGLASGAAAEQFSFVGARATGMGGANAASVKDATAQWHNPAAFGFMNQQTNAIDNNGLSDNNWGWNVVGVGIGYNMTEDMGRYLDILTDVDFDSVSESSLGTSGEIRDLVALAAALKGVSEPGNAFYVDSTVGTSMRIGSFGVGFRVFSEAMARVDELDTLNLGLIESVDLNTDIDAIRTGDAGFVGYTPSVLTTAQRTDLTTAGLSSANIDYLDFQLNGLLGDGTLEASDIAGASDLLSDIVDATGGGGVLDSNLTAIAANGFAVAEIPVSYGHAISDNLSVGVTAKAMFGKVLGTKIWVFDEDNLDSAVENVSDTENETLTFGLDVGALYRINNFQFAAVGHNLNHPTFDGYTDTLTVNGSNVTFNVGDVTLDPQITLGAAFVPSERLTLEVNYDVFTTGTLLSGYDIQRFSFGGEFDLWLLALRAGAYKNLAETAEAWVATAGVGVNIFGAHVDVGAAYSIGENAEYDGNEIPTQARLYAGVGLDF
jgi:hypothetical protein